MESGGLSGACARPSDDGATGASGGLGFEVWGFRGFGFRVWGFRV